MSLAEAPTENSLLASLKDLRATLDVTGCMTRNPFGIAGEDISLKEVFQMFARDIDRAKVKLAEIAQMDVAQQTTGVKTAARLVDMYTRSRTGETDYEALISGRRNSLGHCLTLMEAQVRSAGHYQPDTMHRVAAGLNTMSVILAAAPKILKFEGQ